MKRVILLLAAMAATMVVASGVALAVTKIGTNGPDVLRGTNGADNLIGLGGNDVLTGLGGRDNLIGGPGKDVVFGFLGGDKNLVGGPGNDRVGGGKGSDRVVGGEGNDFLSGDPGAGGPWRDIMSGGAGTDVFFAANRPGSKDIVLCGGGVDWVFADRKDVIAPNCERVADRDSEFERLFFSIPESFFEGLPPIPPGVL